MGISVGREIRRSRSAVQTFGNVTIGFHRGKCSTILYSHCMIQIVLNKLSHDCHYSNITHFVEMHTARVQTLDPRDKV